MTTRERLLNLIDLLSEEQLQAVLHVLEVMLSVKAEPYDPAKDTMVGLYKGGSPDLSERVEDILEQIETERK